MSRKTRKDDPTETDVESLPWWRRPGRGAALSLLTLVVMLLAVGAGLEHLKARVNTLPEYNPKPKLLLMDTPKWLEREGWHQQILTSVRLPEDPQWLGGKLLQDVAQQLASSGWVSQVKHVDQGVDGSIRIWCEYRRPIAMVRTKRLDSGIYEYVAIDKDGVRLPQVYRNAGESGWLEIIGVEAAVPEPGQPFQGDDAEAAARLAQVIEQQKIARRICAIDVSNFHGRKNKRLDQIFLHRRGSAEPIVWGSPIGEEFEEPSCQEKIGLITAALESVAPHVQVDVSCYTDRVIMRGEPAVRTVDGSQTRDR